eukprot:1247371-Amphidinium_carterae.1
MHVTKSWLPPEALVRIRIKDASTFNFFERSSFCKNFKPLEFGFWSLLTIVLNCDVGLDGSPLLEYFKGSPSRFGFPDYLKSDAVHASLIYTACRASA